MTLKDELGCLDIQLQYFLTQQRKSHNSTCKSSYKLMFGRNVRIRKVKPYAAKTA